MYIEPRVKMPITSFPAVIIRSSTRCRCFDDLCRLDKSDGTSDNVLTPGTCSADEKYPFVKSILT
jgi:hypothetical protein